MSSFFFHRSQATLAIPALTGWMTAVASGAEPAEESSRRTLAETTKADIFAAQHGDLGAARRLVEMYQIRMARFVYSIVLNQSDLDDVTQQVFIRMCQRVHTLKQVELFEPWLYQLARRVSLDFLRREKFRRLWCSLEDLVREPVVEKPVTASGASSDDVREVLSQLSVADRELLLLAGEGRTYEEIAELQRSSRGSIKGRLHRLREWLRKELADGAS